MEVPEFGVVAIRQGHEVGADAVRDLHEVGCVARVLQAAPVGDGRYLVRQHGRARASTWTRSWHGAGTAYLTGEVTLLEERTGDAEEVAGLADRLRGALHDYAATVGAEEPRVAGRRRGALVCRGRGRGARPGRPAAAARRRATPRPGCGSA